ncbi:MAG: hypothetical protein U0787_17410 [Polyangia bacterium]
MCQAQDVITEVVSMLRIGDRELAAFSEFALLRPAGLPSFAQKGRKPATPLWTVAVAPTAQRLHGDLCKYAAHLFDVVQGQAPDVFLGFGGGCTAIAELCGSFREQTFGLPCCVLATKSPGSLGMDNGNRCAKVGMQGN